MADNVKGLTWDGSGEREYSTGTKQGVLFNTYKDSGTAAVDEAVKAKTTYGKGVAWNGLTAVTETPGGAEANDNYADDIKYVSLRGAETFNQTIEAFMAPDAWSACDGQKTVGGIGKFGQQDREAFGFAFLSTKGNDTNKNLNGFEIHVTYNLTASPAERAYQTINENPELITYSWECTSDPVSTGKTNSTPNTGKPVSNVIVTCTMENGVLKPDGNGSWDWNTDSSTTGHAQRAKNAKAIYETIFGRDAVAASGGSSAITGVYSTLPLPEKLYAMLTSTDTSIDAATYGCTAADYGES